MTSPNNHSRDPQPAEVRLRNVIESDLEIFFEQQLDPESIRMAAFTANSAKCTSCSSMSGGGLYIQRPTTGASSITLSTFDSNKAWFGSGIASETSVQLTLTKFYLYKQRQPYPGRIKRLRGRGGCLLDARR